MIRIGTEKPLTEDERGRLLGELKYWQDRSETFYSTRRKEERAFNAIWKGQKPSGVVEDSDESAAWPFEGASDQRVRWGDTAFQEYLALIMVALDNCKIEITCNGTADGERRAGAIQRLLRWIRQKLGAKWYAQIQAMMRYMLVDTPAVAAMDVSWSNKRTMGVIVIEMDKTAREYATWRVNADAYVAEDEAKREFAAAVAGDYDENALSTIQAFFATKGCRDEDVEDILEALNNEGECEVLAVANNWEGPDICALRYGEDFMIPANTEDFDYANPLCRQQWIDENQLRELADNEGWDKKWVEDTLLHKGCAFYDTTNYSDTEDMKNSVNIVWFYTAETDDDGTTTRYVSVLSLADGSAFGKRVLRARRGKWETVFFRREVLANNCLSSRGLAHICAPDQGLAKIMKDMANNNAIVGSLPPVKAKGARVRNAVLEPFGTINMAQSDDLSFMQPPAYPAAAKEQLKALKDDLLAFLGLSNGETDVSARQQSFTAWMMSQFEDLYKRLVELAQDYASDEALLSVTGETDVAGIRHEDIDGDFQLALRFNPANMNHKDLIERVNALAQVITPLDAKNEIDRGPVLRNAFLQLFPECQNSSFKSADQLIADDVKDEENNFVKIKAGIMPQMDTSGKWNYQARLEFYQRLRQENPEALSDLPQMSQQMLERWLQALQQQQTQFGENAEIGKTGVVGVQSE